MPTVHRSGPYRFFFYAGDRDEPPHVHVERDNNKAKFWLEPIDLAANYGFNTRELSEIRKIVAVHQDSFLEAWNEHLNA